MATRPYEPFSMSEFESFKSEDTAYEPFSMDEFNQFKSEDVTFEPFSMEEFGQLGEGAVTPTYEPFSLDEFEQFKGGAPAIPEPQIEPPVQAPPEILPFSTFGAFETSTAETPETAPIRAIASGVRQVAQDVADIPRGTGEAVITLGRGLAGAFIGAGAGLQALYHELTKSVPRGEAIDWIGIQNVMREEMETALPAYEPTTEFGRTVSEVAASPFTVLNESARVLSEKVTDDPQKQKAIQVGVELVAILGPVAKVKLSKSGAYTPKEFKQIERIEKQIRKNPEVKRLLEEEQFKPASEIVDRLLEEKPVEKSIERITPTERPVEVPVERPIAEAPIERVVEAPPEAPPVGKPLPQPEAPRAGSLAFGQPLPKRAGNINLERIGADYSAKKAILDTSENYRGTINEARRDTITHEATREMADSLNMSVDELLQRRKGQAFNAEEITASRDLLNASATNLIRLQKEAVALGTEEALVTFRLEMNRHAAIQAEVSGAAAEAGRALSAHRIVSQEGRNYKAMLDSLGGEKLNKEMLDRLSMIDPTDQVAVNKFIRRAVKPEWQDLLFEAWVNALLSSPKTHAVNTLSNSLVFLTKAPERALAATIETGRAAVQRVPRERFFGEISHNTFGAYHGVKEGGRKAIQTFLTEMPSEGVSKLEVARFRSIPGRAGEAVRLPGRLLMMSDEFFKTLNYQSEISGLAYRQATRSGLKGQKRLNKIAELIENPTVEMVKEAKAEMLYRVFQKELGSAGKSFQKIRTDVPGLRYIVPFVRTPVNIAKFGLERTPLNYPRLIKQIVKGEIKGGKISTELAKPTLGSIVGAVVALEALEGNVTGGGPRDRGERDALYRTGWRPYSWKIGDTYYNYGRLEPLGMVVGLTADFVELTATMSEGEREEIASKVALALGQNIINKTFMQGLSGAINAVSDPDRYGDQWVKGFIRTAIPRGVAGVTRGIDPEVKAPDTYMEVLRSQIPFLSQGVRPRRNLWGESVEVEGLPIERVLSPVGRAEQRDSKIDNEMLRLKIFTSLPMAMVRGVEITPDEHDRLIVMSGTKAKKILDDRVNSARYRQADDFGKKMIIETIISKTRDAARDKLYREIAKKSPERISAVRRGITESLK